MKINEIMASAPKIKRKKKVDPCPNPLFVQWLTVWRDEAAEKGIKTQYAYGKVSIKTVEFCSLHFFLDQLKCKNWHLGSLLITIEVNGSPAISGLSSRF